MRKLLLFGVLLLSTGLLQSQNLVSTSPQNKKVVLEQFTGIRCGYCPNGHSTSQAIKAQNPNDVFLIYVHTGDYARPSSGRPDFRTDFGEALANQAEATNYPTGTVNRKGKARSRGSWERYVNQTLQESSYVNIAGSASINTNTKELEVTIEVYYTDDSPETTNKLNIALLQDNTIGYQRGASSTSSYVHMHRLVHFLTGQWGENITNTTEGSFSQFSYTYSIPEDYREQDVVLDNLKLIAFVAEGQDEILTGTRIQPTFVNRAINDVAIKKIKDIQPTCSDKISPKIEIENLGGANLTTLAITYSVNGSNSLTHNWTGNVRPNAKKTITLNEISFTPNDQVNTIEVSLSDDDNNDNNTKSRTFQTAVEGSIFSTLTIDANATGPTTTWEIVNNHGDVIYSGGPYNAFSSHTYDLELSDGCYEFQVKDSEGLGQTMFIMEDDNGIELFKTETDYGIGIDRSFKTNSLLNNDKVAHESIILYPNPTNGIVHIENAEDYQVEIYTILGKQVFNKLSIGKQESINLGNLPSGVYYVKLQNKQAVIVKKLIVR